MTRPAPTLREVLSVASTMSFLFGILTGLGLSLILFGAKLR